MRLEVQKLFTGLFSVFLLSFVMLFPVQTEAAAKEYSLTVQAVCKQTALSDGVTFDVYVGGNRVAKSVSNYKGKVPSGAAYVIKNIKTNEKYSYSGGTVKGTMPAAGKTVSLTVQANPKIAYKVNGGTGKMSTYYGQKGTTVSLSPCSFTREGYLFAGWSKTADGTAAYKNEAKVSLTGNLTLYAVWKPCTMTLKFSANGGTITTDTSAAKQYRIVSDIVQMSKDGGKTWADAVNKITTVDPYKDLTNAATFGLTKYGYHTEGVREYNTKADGSGTDVNRNSSANSPENPASIPALNGGKALASNKTKTLYVNWIPNTYTVHFDPNGGTGEMPDQQFTCGVSQKSHKNTFTREGYVFIGWTTARDGSSNLYPSGKTFTRLTSVHKKTVTLYANWAKLYTLDVSCADPEIPFTVHVNDQEVYRGTDTYTAELLSGDTFSVTALPPEDPHLQIETPVQTGTIGNADRSVDILFTRTSCDSDGPLTVLFPATDTEPGEGRKTCSICGQETETVVFPAHNTMNSSINYSADAGFYKQVAMNLFLSSPSGLPIYYTTDGSLPGADAQPYDGSIPLTDADTNASLIELLQNELADDRVILTEYTLPTATVIRAAVQYPDGTFGEAYTRTYFLNSDISHFNCTVLSLTADPSDLLDYYTGIMAKGFLFDQNIFYNNQMLEEGTVWKIIANYTQVGRDWERPAYFECFDYSNSLSCSGPCGMQIEGGNARTYAQKSFNVYFRPEYDMEGLSYPVFWNTAPGYAAGNISSFKSLSIRAGGNDTEMLKFRDMMFQEMLSGRSFAVQAGKPAVLFLNGEYYGAFILNEKFSDWFIEDHYGVAADNVMLYEDDQLEEGLESDDVYYQELLAFADRDLTNPEEWNAFTALVDIDSMADYYAAEIFIGNADWSEDHNYRLWRARNKDNTFYGDGRWRFILYDTEFSSYLYKDERCAADYNHFQDALASCPVFASAMRNSEFADLFGQYLYEINGIFSPGNVSMFLNAYYAEWSSRIFENFRRFETNLNLIDFDLSSITEFYASRSEYILDYYEQYMEENF